MFHETLLLYHQFMDPTCYASHACFNPLSAYARLDPTFWVTASSNILGLNLLKVTYL